MHTCHLSHIQTCQLSPIQISRVSQDIQRKCFISYWLVNVSWPAISYTVHYTVKVVTSQGDHYAFVTPKCAVTWSCFILSNMTRTVDQCNSPVHLVTMRTDILFDVSLLSKQFPKFCVARYKSAFVYVYVCICITFHDKIKVSFVLCGKKANRKALHIKRID